MLFFLFLSLLIFFFFVLGLGLAIVIDRVFVFASLDALLCPFYFSGSCHWSRPSSHLPKNITIVTAMAVTSAVCPSPLPQVSLKNDRSTQHNDHFRVLRSPSDSYLALDLADLPTRLPCRGDVKLPLLTTVSDGLTPVQLQVTGYMTPVQLQVTSYMTPVQLQVTGYMTPVQLQVTGYMTPVQLQVTSYKTPVQLQVTSYIRPFSCK